jgi:hypothetical protein
VKVGVPIHGGKTTSLCEICGKTFDLFPSRIGVEKYCSKNCSMAGARKSISAAAKKRYLDENVRAQASIRTRNAWADPEKKKNHDISLRTREYRKRRSDIARKKMSDPAIRAKLSDSLRRSKRHKAAMLIRELAPVHNWQEYRGLKFRSKWEKDFARWMDMKNIPWEYESQKFVLSDGRPYTPDFLVGTASGKCFVELHRLESVKPGDEGKIRKLLIAEKELNPPLLLFGERFMCAVQKELRALSRPGGRRCWERKTSRRW